METHWTEFKRKVPNPFWNISSNSKADGHYGVESRTVSSETWGQVLLSGCMSAGCSMKGTCFFWQIGSGNSTGLGQSKRHIPNGSTVSFRNLQNQMIHAHSLENQVVLKCLYKHITICHI